MPVRTVNPIASFVSGVFTQPYLVKNSGTVTVYLGQDSSLSVATRAISMPPGSTLNWSGDTELWAIADAGNVGELEILYTGENAFTPGPTTVDLGSPVDIERATTLIFDQVVTVNAGVTLTVGDIDVSAYDSIIVLLSHDSGATTVGNEVRLDLWWKPAGAIGLWPSNNPVTSTGGFMTYITATLAENVQIQIQPVIVAANYNARLRIYGSKVELPHYYSHVPPTPYAIANWTAAPDQNVSWDAAEGQLWLIGTCTALEGSAQLAHIGGLATLAWGRVTGGAGGRFLYLKTHTTGATGKFVMRYDNTVDFSLQGEQGKQLWLPERPIYLVASAGSTVIFNMTLPPTGKF